MILSPWLDTSTVLTRRTIPRAGIHSTWLQCYTKGRCCSYAKHHLPNYGVFDEYRYFKPGNELHVLRIRGIDIAIAICEDLWQDGGPVAATAEANAGLLAVINASPYEQDRTTCAATWLPAEPGRRAARSPT